MSDRSTPTQSVHAFPATALRLQGEARLRNGGKQRTPLRINGDYMLDHDFARGRLSLRVDAKTGWHAAENTALGRSGARLQPDCVLTFASPDGQTHDAVLIYQLDELDQIETTYLIPTFDLSPRVKYTLVSIDTDAPRDAMGHIRCLSFMRGTRILLASGEQRRIEELRVGDRVRTRDAGPKEIRWIGESAMAAHGDLTPVLIEAGALDNTHDLVVSPNHRLFVPRRHASHDPSSTDIIVKASHLMNGDSVRSLPAVQMDCTQILLDQHYPIFAEGIAAETTLTVPKAKPSLPPELLDRLTNLMPGQTGYKRRGLDVQQALLTRPDAFDLILRASLQ